MYNHLTEGLCFFQRRKLTIYRNLTKRLASGLWRDFPKNGGWLSVRRRITPHEGVTKPLDRPSREDFAQ
ncbi:MAG TPA: hypothetical protein VFH42_08610 [Sporolactobacillaceae bacterium]|nr:hypothetical protein [Sporolactobacillaceae bacterium]